MPVKYDCQLVQGLMNMVDDSTSKFSLSNLSSVVENFPVSIDLTLVV